MDCDDRRLASFFAICALLVTVGLPGSAEGAGQADRQVATAITPQGQSAYTAGSEGQPSTLLRRSVYDSGRWSIGLDGNFSMTTSRVELLDDNGQATDSTLFMRLDPSVTVGVIDRLHVGLVFGIVARRLAQEDADPTTDTAIAFQPLVQYFIPVSRRVAIYTQAATGAYIGRSQRTVPAEEGSGTVIANERTRTRGFIMTVGAGINYRLTEGLQLRFGLAFNGIWGREAVETLDESLSASTTNLQTSTGIRYTF